MSHEISAEQIERACSDLGIVFDDTLTDRKVFESFGEITEKTDLHVSAKVIVLRHMATKQLIEGDKKYFSFDTPFKACNDCRGVGEIFTRDFNTMSVPCEDCKGKGIKTAICSECKGSGKTESGEGKCRLCRGSGKYYFRANKYRKEDIPCPQCFDREKGKALGHRKVQIPTGHITGSYPCTCKDGKAKVHIHKPSAPAEKKSTSVGSSAISDAMKKAIKDKAPEEVVNEHPKGHELTIDEDTGVVDMEFDKKPIGAS